MSAFVARYDALVNELRTKVKVLPHGASEKSAIELTCLWDTGAQFSVITPRVADILGLDAVDLKKAYTANGIYETPVYRLDVILPAGHRVSGLKVSTGNLLVCDMLIGMDVIGRGDFLLTNKGATEFAFRIPSEGKSPL